MWRHHLQTPTFLLWSLTYLCLWRGAGIVNLEEQLLIWSSALGSPASVPLAGSPSVALWLQPPSETLCLVPNAAHSKLEDFFFCFLKTLPYFFSLKAFVPLLNSYLCIPPTHTHTQNRHLQLTFLPWKYLTHTHLKLILPCVIVAHIQHSLTLPLNRSLVWVLYVMKHEINNYLSLYTFITASCSLYNSEQPQMDQNIIISKLIV